MKKLPVILFILFYQFSFSQQTSLLIKSGAKGKFLEHKVTPKENFYSIGRMYNVHPKELAAYNSLDMTRGLNLGQMIRIPLSAVNFNQSKEVGIPVFYRPGEKEGLLKISQVNNNVPVDLLKRWNKMENDNVKAGLPLIVGYLVLTPAEAGVKTEPEVIVKPKEEAVVKTVPVNTEPVKEEPRIAVKKEEIKTETKKPDTEATEPGQGFFKTHFEKQVRISPAKKNQTVTAGIFKTTSGWNDAKYYLLMDAVQPGTIVKLINPSNKKTIYAKVLGEMSGIRQNEGYDIRISNAAASALMIPDDEKFIVNVNY